MQINATLVNLYNVCKRELWLHANGIRFEQTSDLVFEGKLIHEESYPQRSEKYEEVEMDGIKVDYYDAKNKVIHEIKKSNKVEKAHEWQVKYYIYVFERKGIEGVTGKLEYPTLRQTDEVVLCDVDRDMIREIEAEIRKIVESDTCPPLVRKGVCRNCSYFDFCFAEELEVTDSLDKKGEND
ncbi:MAG: CRISPR-associated protein Cas4 [Paludibacteraceae bacterium]|nr:CRISPR-associated protein Cas4 [Paludibacteraceae bacterium]HOI27217.1 CRISPR-associated protein Cas4 [Paludibacteraceae bacterium]HPH62421.1 CRISPR-associated protein Cas4 [Paludibacteraceae bacterium]